MLASTSFVPTVEDTIAFYRHAARTSVVVKDAVKRAKGRGRWLGVCLGVLVAALYLTSTVSGGEFLKPYFQYGVPVLCLTGVFVIAMLVIRQRGKLFTASVNSGVWEEQIRTGVIEADLRPRRIALDSSGMWVDLSSARVWYSWSTVQRVDESEDRMFVYVTRDQAVTVPRRAFASSSEAEKFVAIVRERLRREHGPVSPPTVAAKV